MATFADLLRGARTTAATTGAAFLDAFSGYAGGGKVGQYVPYSLQNRDYQRSIAEAANRNAYTTQLRDQLAETMRRQQELYATQDRMNALRQAQGEVGLSTSLDAADFARQSNPLALDSARLANEAAANRESRAAGLYPGQQTLQQQQITAGEQGIASGRRQAALETALQPGKVLAAEEATRAALAENIANEYERQGVIQLYNPPQGPERVGAPVSEERLQGAEVYADRLLAAGDVETAQQVRSAVRAARDVARGGAIQSDVTPAQALTGLPYANAKFAGDRAELADLYKELDYPATAMATRQGDLAPGIALEKQGAAAAAKEAAGGGRTEDPAFKFRRARVFKDIDQDLSNRFAEATQSGSEIIAEQRSALQAVADLHLNATESLYQSIGEIDAQVHETVKEADTIREKLFAAMADYGEKAPRNSFSLTDMAVALYSHSVTPKMARTFPPAVVERFFGDWSVPQSAQQPGAATQPTESRQTGGSPADVSKMELRQGFPGLVPLAAALPAAAASPFMVDGRFDPTLALGRSLSQAGRLIGRGVGKVARGGGWLEFGQGALKPPAPIEDVPYIGNPYRVY